MANLLSLHHFCHTAIHDQPRRSYAQGFLVPRYHGDPETWRVHRFRRIWMQPTDTGWTPAQPHPLQDAAA